MPLKEIELEVGGYRDDRLTHLYRQQSQNSGKLGLFLPGVGYGIKFPALLYAASLFTDLDWDTFALETRYASATFQGTEEAEQIRWLQADVVGAYRAAWTAREHTRLCVVAKSLGTLGLHLLQDAEALPPSARFVWLTPLLGRPEILNRVVECARQSLVVIGTEDPHFTPERMTTLEQAGARMLVLDGTNHSLNIDGNTLASVENLRRLLEVMRDFLRS